jgi:hypothetical protein
MPGAHHPVVVRKRCIQLWLALATATGAADPVAVATSLELEFERRVPVPNVYRWVRDEAEHGFAESIRQRGAIVRTEMLELEAKRVKRSRIPAEVRLAVFQAVKENPFLYARELADHVHHLTGMMFSDEAIGRVRRDLAFKRRRAGIPLGEADPIEQRMYKNLWHDQNIQDEQVIFIDEVSCSERARWHACTQATNCVVMMITRPARTRPTSTARTASSSVVRPTPTRTPPGTTSAHAVRTRRSGFSPSTA